jgi:hypothetical protein
VGITVEFAGEPPLTLEHALAHDSAPWTEVYLSWVVCKVVAPPPLSKNLSKMDHLFDELLTCKDSSSRLAVRLLLCLHRIRFTWLTPDL